MRVTGIDHVVFNVADVEKSVAWWRDLLGLEPVRLEEWRRGEVPFVSVRISPGTIIDLFARERSGENVNHIALQVADADLDDLVASGRFDVDAWAARAVRGDGTGPRHLRPRPRRQRDRAAHLPLTSRADDLLPGPPFGETAHRIEGGPMESFRGKLAVVTGGGTGMGRELTRQLAAEGCDVAICDVSATNMADTVAACAAESPDATVTSFVADVSSEADLVAFRDHVASAHATDHIDLLFNNAGIGGGGSLVNDSREEWEQVFNVCWGGVYLGVRTFLPLLLQSEEARIVNTSSVNGFWATLGPTTSHTAYSAAKFAVKGFSEALITDLANTAPHIGVSVVMPGHIGTSIVFNSGSYFGRDPKELDEEQVAQLRERIGGRGSTCRRPPTRTCAT